MKIVQMNNLLVKQGPAIRNRLTRCIDRRRECDRIVDCEDKSDERSCNASSSVRYSEFSNCPTGYVSCPDRKTCYLQNEQTCGM